MNPQQKKNKKNKQVKSNNFKDKIENPVENQVDIKTNPSTQNPTKEAKLNGAVVNNKTAGNLKKWNISMGTLHLIQGVIMLVLSKDITKIITTTLPSISFNIETRVRTVTNITEKWYDINLGRTIAAFLFLSAFAHFFTILPKIYPWYLKNLANKINLIRWYEYALSSSIMIYVVCVLNGITDGFLLFAIVGLNACMNLFGASMEYHNSDKRKLSILEKKEFKPNWWHFVYGCFAGILPWIISGVYFYVSINRLSDLASTSDQIKNALNTVKFIFPALFVFFNCFAINMVLQYKGVGKWKDYLFGEKVYLILSLVAKSFLAWFIWGGTLR